MSGGSFNYLYAQDPYDEDDLRKMASYLLSWGMPDAAEATIALIPPRADEALAGLWRAAEWFRSADWGFERVEEWYAAWLKLRTPKDAS